MRRLKNLWQKSSSVGKLIMSTGVFLLMVVILLIGVIVIFTSQDNSISVRDVEVTNITDTAFTLTWVSDEKYEGRVVYKEGEGWPVLLAQVGQAVAFDDRDVELREDGTYRVSDAGIKTRYTHHVTVRNLKPDTEYSFRIAGKINGKESEISEVKTKTIIEDLNTPDPGYGKVENANNEDAMIILTHKDNPEVALSSYLSPEGTYSIDFNNFGVEEVEATRFLVDLISEKKKIEDLEYESVKYKPLDTLVINSLSENQSSINSQFAPIKKTSAIDLDVYLNDVDCGPDDNPNFGPRFDNSINGLYINEAVDVYFENMYEQSNSSDNQLLDLMMEEYRKALNWCGCWRAPQYQQWKEDNTPALVSEFNNNWVKPTTIKEMNDTCQEIFYGDIDRRNISWRAGDMAVDVQNYSNSDGEIDFSETSCNGPVYIDKNALSRCKNTDSGVCEYSNDDKIVFFVENGNNTRQCNLFSFSDDNDNTSDSGESARSGGITYYSLGDGCAAQEIYPDDYEHVSGNKSIVSDGESIVFIRDKGTCDYYNKVQSDPETGEVDIRRVFQFYFNDEGFSEQNAEAYAASSIDLQEDTIEDEGIYIFSVTSQGTECSLLTYPINAQEKKLLEESCLMDFWDTPGKTCEIQNNGEKKIYFNEGQTDVNLDYCTAHKEEEYIPVKPERFYSAYISEYWEDELIYDCVSMPSEKFHLNISREDIEENCGSKDIDDTCIVGKNKVEIFIEDSRGFPNCQEAIQNWDPRQLRIDKYYSTYQTYDEESSCYLLPTRNSPDLTFDRLFSECADHEYGDVCEIDDYEVFVERSRIMDVCKRYIGEDHSSIIDYEDKGMANMLIVNNIKAESGFSSNDKQNSVLGAERQRENEGIEATESGRYIFFQDGERIAQSDVIVQGDKITIKLFNDVNGNGIKDEGEEFFDDYSQIDLEKEASAEEFTLTSGWNLINIPMYDTRTENAVVKASDLLDYWNEQGVDIKHVARFVGGKFQMYSKRESGTEYSPDFDLLPGEALFVLNYSNQRAVSFSGRRYLGVNLTMENGWNLVGIVPEGETNYDTEGLFTAMGDQGVQASVISQYESGKYESVIKEDETLFGNNYTILDKRGYFIKVEEGGDLNFTP